MKSAITIAISCLMTAVLSADETESPTASVGKQAPPLSATTIEGETFRLHEALKKKRRHAVLIFSRANW